MAKILVDMLQGGHYSFLEELPQRAPEMYETPKQPVLHGSNMDYKF
jgi:hypothetical protein